MERLAPTHHKSSVPLQKNNNHSPVHRLRDTQRAVPGRYRKKRIFELVFMQLMNVKILEKKGNDALKKLRRTRLEKGLPFMLNAKELPSRQCYLEYADGRIVLVSMKTPQDRDFTIIRELSAAEINSVRRKFQLV